MSTNTIINNTNTINNNEEMDQEFQEMREYDEIIQYIQAPNQDPTVEDVFTEQQAAAQEPIQQPVLPQQEEQQEDIPCMCACCQGTCACGRGHACDQDDQEEESWRYDWYSGLEWNESGYFD